MLMLLNQCFQICGLFSSMMSLLVIVVFKLFLLISFQTGKLHCSKTIAIGIVKTMYKAVFQFGNNHELISKS